MNPSSGLSNFFASIPNWESLVFFITVVIWWAMMRPAMVRDYDSRRLPTNPTARLVFAFMCVVVFLIIFLTFHSFQGLASRIGHSLPVVGGFVDNFKDQAALLAAISLMGLLQLSFVRDVERGTLIWLHSRRHLHDDSEILSRHLRSAGFEPAPEERRKNRETVQKYGIYVTDESFDAVGLPAFAKWRKVATLLRILGNWNQDENRFLSQEDMAELRRIHTAHERKTQLAMTIVKMVEEVGKSGEKSQALAELLTMLSETPHADRTRIEAAEARAKNLVGDAQEEFAQRPLRLTGKELRTLLAQIEGYFEVEYDFLLDETASFTAKSVVLCGPDAGLRLDQLKEAGFSGLGRVEPISFDRIIWLFILICFGGFLIMFLGNTASNTQQVEGLARFTFTMAIAALLGASVGSRRRYARAKITPWSQYLLAGVAAGGIFMAINFVAFEIKKAFNVELAPGQMPFSLERMLPWAMLPCVMTITIGWLGRWQWPILPERYRQYVPVYERLLDGIAVSAAMLIGYFIAIALHPLLGADLPPSIQELMKETAGKRIFPYPIFITLQILGFLVGFATVRDARRAAHATIIELADSLTRKPLMGAAKRPQDRVNEGA